ncbi:MAG: ABC transporter permease subunit [Clostridia bacterium]|nr:ABC transporter permease subunit [Clostridia bacterium]
MLNPVLRKEIKTSTRTWKTPMMVTFYVGMLLLIMAFAFWTQVIDSYNPTVEPSFVRDLFIGMAYFQLSLILFLSPSMTTAAISGERQRSTFDVLLSTRLSARSIVLGKLLAGLYKIFMLIVASIPVFSVIYLFGGIGFVDLILFVGVCMMSALMMGSIGILMSSVFKKTTTASVISYGILLSLTIGVMMLAGATYLIVDNYGGYSADLAYLFMYLHPFAPLSIFMDINLGLGLDLLNFGSGNSSNFMNLFITLGIQLAISCGCILLAARRINPVGRAKRKVVS